ncbi:hypothetical protein HT102_13445 [Hoyosella sp. G463]|uniref:Uncharacterized protein n=1 Tax=Lolliginicoccus lacisalsi TaxID=2742202 RepID=A0A927PN29_9ACTN|nr:hypothetical protein [Lolliginicoccus lacisalsi]MBD8507487.1 hypothetical protein [Lolliginicoccus lacisalsi]
MSTNEAVRAAIQDNVAARMLADDLHRTLATHEPESAAELSGLRSIRAPRTREVIDVVVIGAGEPGRGGLIEALNATDVTGSVRYVERELEPGYEDGVTIPVALMVFDAAGPIGSTELAELRSLAHSVDQVVFAITKTDMHTNWRQVRDRDAQLLSIHTPRFTGAEIHPVATPLVHAANDRRDTDPEAARSLADSAGIDALHAAVLDSLPAPRTDYVARNVLWSMVGALQDAQAARQRIGRDIQNNPEINRLHRVRAELLRTRGAGRTEDLTTVRADIQRARVDLGHEVTGWSSSTAALARNEIDALDGRALADYPARIRQLVRAGRDQNEARITEHATELFTTRSLPVPAPVTGSTPRPDAEAASDQATAGAPDIMPRRGPEDYVIAVLGASAGLGLGRLFLGPLALMPVIDMIAIPLTLLLGVVVALWMLRVRRQVVARGRLREWTATQISQARALMEREVANRLVTAEQHLVTATNETHDRRIAGTDENIADHEASLRMLTARRDDRLAELTGEINDMNRAIDRAVAFLRGPDEQAEQAG